MKTTLPSRRTGFGASPAALRTALLFALGAQLAPGFVLTFQNITSNAPSITDLSMQVTDLGGGQVLLQATKGVSFTGFIDEIYIEDSQGLLSGMSFSLVNSLGTASYTSPATPASPPGIGAFTVDFSFEANVPPNSNRIDPGDTGGFIGTLAGLSSFQDLEDAAIASDFRVAYHVKGLNPGGQSDSYLSVPPLGDPVIPEPTVTALGVIGLTLLVSRRRRE